MAAYIFYFLVLQLILLIPSHSFYQRILVKRGIEMTKVPALVLTLTMPLVYTAIFIAGYVYVFAPWIRSEKFDSKTWKHEERKRYTMVKDVIETKLLIGKTREEVIAFLGEDFENGPCGDCIGYSTYDPDQPGFLDHDVLEIDFHEKRVDTVFTNAW